MELKERDVLLGLHEIEGVGWETIQLIVEAVPDLRELLERPVSELLSARRIAARRARSIEAVLTNSFIEGKLRFYEGCGVRPITLYDEEYPPSLRFIHKPPWVLYTLGNIELLHAPSVAVVGTRHPTPYGREVAEWFGAELASAGLPVVSGLARGIDGCAHAGALRTTGDTIAVLGNGLNVCYPSEHHALQRAIGERGLLVSEYAWNTRPSHGTFPFRNRIIAGLSRGTVVVEAAARSGSLITAELAASYGRDVFAVPGLITSPKSAGVYDLLDAGAMLATSPSVVAREYGAAAASARTAGYGQAPEEEPTAEERLVLDAMGAAPASIDDLLRRTELTFGHLHTVLLSLLVKKRIRALPGSSYIARMN